VCPDGSAPRDRQADLELRNILGLDEAGEGHPLERYDIGCDEGAWNAFLRKLWCSAQAMPFAIGKWTIGIGIDLMGWALEFRLARSLTPLAGLLSDVYDTSLIGPLGLRQLAWTCAMFASGWHFLRARAARGLGEIAVTFVIATVGAIVLANPQGYLEGSVTLAQNTSGAVLEATDDILGGSADRDAEPVRDRLSDVLRRSFVGEPYDLINWGEPLTGECARARDEILDGGPWGSDDEPRDVMRDHGCDRAAEFNARPTDSRAAASLIVALAAVGATVLLGAVTLGVFVAQLTLVAIFAGASLVWALALFPGGRDLLWWWLERLAWSITATVGATFVLSWLAVTVTAALSATSDLSIVQRCLVVLLVVAFGFRLRGQIGRSVEAMSRRFGNRVAQVSTRGRSHLGTAVASGGVGVGIGLSATARSWAYDTPGGRYLHSRLYARHFTRAYRRGGPLRSTRQALGHAEAALGRAANAGTSTVRTFGRAARAVALAPITGPAAVATVRSRATASSRRLRTRLGAAQATRQQWASNAAHPVQAMRAAQQTQRSRGRPAPQRGGSRATSARARTAAQQRTAAARSWSRGTPQQARARVKQARLAHEQRARERGHPVRALLDAHREAREPIPPPPHDETTDET
jgi:hypothetical protein